jgi:hypothetical protein
MTRRRSWGIAVAQDGRLFLRDDKDRIYMSDESKTYQKCEERRLADSLDKCD